MRFQGEKILSYRPEENVMHGKCQKGTSAEQDNVAIYMQMAYSCKEASRD